MSAVVWVIEYRFGDLDEWVPNPLLGCWEDEKGAQSAAKARRTLHPTTQYRAACYKRSD